MVEARNILTLMGWMILLPFYMMAGIFKVFGKILSFMLWGVVILLGLIL